MKTLPEEAPLALFEPAVAFPRAERTVQSGDVTLAVKTWGDPARPTVVLVHGYPDNSEVWHAAPGSRVRPRACATTRSRA
jgi:hypothetical protein